MSLKSGAICNGAMILGLSALFTGASTQQASAQAIFWGWGPSVSYGYVPPAPIYRPLPPRYVPAPVYPGGMYDDEPRARRLTPAQVRSTLNARGLRVTSVPTRNGGVFVADVSDRAGNQRRVIVDGYYGRILQTFPAHAVREMPAPGPRYAGRPLDPDVDTDEVSPRGPVVIPGIGSGRSEPSGQRPRASEQKKKKPTKAIAAKPPAAVPAAIPAPAAVAPEPVTAAPAAPLPAPAPVEAVTPRPAPPVAAVPPVQPEPRVIPAPPAAPAPIPAPQQAVAPPASEPPPSATPGSTAAPVTGEPDPATTPAPRATTEEPPADRPRRRVRFIKPDSPTVANPNVPGGQLVPIPEPPPVVVAPRAAEAPAPAQRAGRPGAPQGSSVLE